MDTTDREIIRKLRYEPETGKLFWKEIKPANKWDKGYNTRFAGKEAGHIRKSGPRKGYLEIFVCGKTVSSHKIAWLLYYGRWPSKEIDHINNIRHDNMISNLRECSRLEQTHNTSKRKTNTSGYTGVSYQKSSGKWVAYINENKMKKYLGSFETAEEAFLVRKSAQLRLDYSDTHGLKENIY